MIKPDIPLINIPEAKDNTVAVSGENAKKLAVILKKEDFENPGNKEKLVAVLKAIQYDLVKDIHLILIENGSAVLLSERIHLADYKNIIAFGRSPNSLGISLRSLAFQWFYLEKQAFLFLPNLTKTMADKANKLKLWNLIKDSL